MNIGFKRLFLALGCLLAAAGIIIGSAALIFRINEKAVKGEVVHIFTMYNGQDPKMVTIEFQANGRTYRRTIEDTPSAPMAVGDSTEVTYNALDPDRIYAPGYHTGIICFAALPLLIAGGIIIVLTRKSAKGFFTEFVSAHKRAASATVVLTVILGAYALWEEVIYEPQGEILAALPEFLLLIALLVTIPAAVITMWIACVIGDISKQKDNTSH
ncbi:MAG: hypothetical protein J5685_06180 [Clostridiales bacterium]|nr:hypothetical protein [Clostridiales bacterium]